MSSEEFPTIDSMASASVEPSEAVGMIVPKLVNTGLDDARPEATPQALWQVNSEVTELLHHAGGLCHDLADGKLDEETAKCRINDISARMIRLSKRSVLLYWFGRAYATRWPPEEPTPPQLLNCHVSCINVINKFLQSLLAHQLLAHSSAGISIRVPQCLESAIDLETLSAIATQFEGYFEDFDDDTQQLRAETDLARKLLTECQKDRQDSIVPEYLGNQRIKVGAEISCLTVSQDTVLQALVELRAASLAELRSHSRVNNPNYILKTIKKSCPLLDPFISFPGGKSKGGYSTTIRDGRDLSMRTATA